MADNLPAVIPKPTITDNIASQPILAGINWKLLGILGAVFVGAMLMSNGGEEEYEDDEEDLEPEEDEEDETEVKTDS